MSIKIKNIRYDTKEEDLIQFLDDKKINYVTCTFRKNKKYPNKHGGSCIVKVDQKIDAVHFAQINGLVNFNINALLSYNYN